MTTTLPNENHKFLFYRRFEAHSRSYLPLSKSVCFNKSSLEETDSKSKKWEKILNLFPDLDKYSVDTISSYEVLAKECNEIIKYFESTKSKVVINDLRSNFLKDKSIMIYITSYNFTTKVVSKLLGEKTDAAETQQALKGLLTLRYFLLINIDDEKNQVILGKYDIPIYKIIKETIQCISQSITKLGKSANVSLIGRFLYCQIEILFALLALHERSNTSDTLEFFKESFEFLCEFLKTSYSNNTFKEILSHEITHDEKWETEEKNNSKAAVIFGRRKFSLIQLKTGNPKLSVQYLILYNLLKTLKSFNLSTIESLKESILETLGLFFKNSLVVLIAMKKQPVSRGQDLLPVELFFNEIAISFDIIKRMVPKLDIPFPLLEKYKYTEFCKPLIVNYNMLVLESRLISFTNALKGNAKSLEEFVDVISYKTSHDYVSTVFKCLNKINSNKKLTSSLILLLEDVLAGIVECLDSLGGIKNSIQILKVYIAEYLFDNKSNLSHNMFGSIVKLLETNTFRFTAPGNLNEPFSVIELEDLTNKRMLLLLKKAIEHDQECAQTTLIHFFELLGKHIKDNISLFGLCKVIYCAIIGEVLDNTSFYNKVYKEKRPEINYELYMKNRDKKITKGMQVLIDIKGINSMIDLLLESFNESKNENNIKLIEWLFLELSGIQFVSEELIKEPCFILKFLVYSNKNIYVTTNFMIQLLSVIKYNPNIVSNESIDSKNYLPICLMNIIEKNIPNTNNTQFNAEIKDVVPLLGLVAYFFSYEEKLHSIKIHQSIFIRDIKLNNLFKTLINSCKENIGDLIQYILLLIGGLQKDNDDAYVHITGLNLISEKKLLIFIKSIISQV